MLLRSTEIVLLAVAAIAAMNFGSSAAAEELRAGVAKVEITDREAGPVNDPLWVKALAIQSGETTAVLITVDAVAIGEIGYITNVYLPTVRQHLKAKLGIEPANVLANASHCHGVVRADVAERTVEAVEAAVQSMVPVTVGSGSGHEDRIMENRRVKLKSGREADVRHAYAFPADEQVAEAGPVDPQIGILRLDRKDDGRTLAVVYNFACHPIQGVPSGGNTADITGFASQVIEDNLDDGAIALFVQGCGGDINPIGYKAVDQPRDAEPLGNLLGLSTLEAVRKIRCRDDARFVVLNETLTLPRVDPTERIYAMEAEQQRLLQSLRGTSLNFETFLPLIVKYKVGGEYPLAPAQRYLHDQALGREHLPRLDAENRRNIEAYAENIRVMEELTRLQTNLALLRKHQRSLLDSGKRTIDVEVAAIRIGDFVLVTFPGELTVRIGLGIKERSPHEQTFVAGYTNGYIYYAPTAEQLRNIGGAQEDSDCILAPAWQQIFEDKVSELLGKL
ncbi:hypothetical protein [Candidatus Laterigemmans baculatus]|uniref:hypothetical protein n=1 Tax=Candidatus Laterigemmans baculatus TaxID=2770505 RepID=UPI001F1B4564|nr:hypothetical protein [Candidatus Laterigemmans baculatus]